MKPQDVAVIIFTGQGVKHKSRTLHLLTAATDFGVEEKSGQANDDIKKRLAGVPGRTLVMLDACDTSAPQLDEQANGPASRPMTPGHVHRSTSRTFCAQVLQLPRLSTPVSTSALGLIPANSQSSWKRALGRAPRPRKTGSPAAVRPAGYS